MVMGKVLSIAKFLLHRTFGSCQARQVVRHLLGAKADASLPGAVLVCFLFIDSLGTTKDPSFAQSKQSGSVPR